MRARGIGIARDLSTLFSVGTATGLPDHQLLELFLARRTKADEAVRAAEAAFEAIVRAMARWSWAFAVATSTIYVMWKTPSRPPSLSWYSGPGQSGSMARSDHGSTG